jgi:hypothetical protein
MMIKFVIILVAAYFVFWGYSYLLVVRFQNALYRRFPKEAEQCLGSKKLFGINTKNGLLFLWQKSVKELSKIDRDIERHRKHASKCIILLLLIIFLIFPIFLIFTVLATIKP